MMDCSVFFARQYCYNVYYDVYLAEQVVVFGHGPLALVHLDQYTGLIVGVCGECLCLLCGNGRVPLDKGGHHTTSCLDTQRQWRDIQQQQVLYLFRFVSMQDGCLYSCGTK